MSDKQWFLRVRGKVTGPFDMAELRSFHARGLLQPHHEISHDQLTWNQVDAVDSLVNELKVPLAPEPHPCPESLAPVPRARVLAAWKGELTGAAIALAAMGLALSILWFTGAIESHVLRSNPGVQHTKDLLARAEKQITKFEDTVLADTKERKQLEKIVADLKRAIQAADQKQDLLTKTLDKANSELAQVKEGAAKAGRDAAQALSRSGAQVAALQAELKRLKQQAAPKSPAADAAPPGPAKPPKLATDKEFLDKLYNQARQAVRAYSLAKDKSDTADAMIRRGQALRLCTRLEELSGSKERTRSLRKVLEDLDSGN